MKQQIMQQQFAQIPLGYGDIGHLRYAAHRAALRGDAARADAAELEYILRSRAEIRRLNGEVVLGRPEQLVRGYGATGRLAVRWCTMHGTIFTDVDGKELPNEQTRIAQNDLWPDDRQAPGPAGPVLPPG